MFFLFLFGSRDYSKVFKLRELAGDRWETGGDKRRASFPACPHSVGGSWRNGIAVSYTHLTLPTNSRV